MLASAVTVALLHVCSPSVGVRTMAAIVTYESGGRPWSIDDDTAHRSYRFASERAAIAAEEQLLAQGHNLDVGLSQVNSANFAERGLTPDTAFDPCTNLRAGAAIITDDYRTAYAHNWIGRPLRTTTDRYEQEQYALWHALQAYNSGHEWGAPRYATSVYRIGLRLATAPRGAPR